MKSLRLFGYFLLISINLISQTAPPRVFDPHRGMSIDKFFRINNISVNAGFPIEDTTHSVLGVDVDNDGVFEKEVDLIEYCKQNHITTISTYDLGNVFRTYNFNGTTDEMKLWDHNSNAYQYARWHLCRFINYAKANGIAEVLASVGSPRLVNTVTSSFRFSQTERSNPSFPSNLLFVEDNSNDGDERAELVKLELRIMGFNSSNPCNERFDGFTYEVEYWNSEKSFQAVRNDLIDIYQIISFFNSINISDPAFVQLYIQNLDDPLTFWNGSDIAQFLDGAPNRPAFFDINGNSSYPAPHPRIVDRLLMVYYSNLILNTSYAAMFPGNFSPPRIAEFRNNSTNVNTQIVPFFNTENRQNGGAIDFLGNWLQLPPNNNNPGNYTIETIHNIFNVEENLYGGYLTTESASGFSNNNYMVPGSAHYYASSQMIEPLKNPEIFYLKTPVLQNSPLILFYEGPTEEIHYDFKIFNPNGTLACQVFNQVNPVVQASPVAYNYQISIPTCQNLLSNTSPYRAEMTIHYSNGFSYTYSRNFFVYSSSDVNPHIEIINDEDPLTPNSSIHCENDPVVIQVGPDFNYNISLSINGGSPFILSSACYSFNTPGVYSVVASRGGNLSETKTITILPNPNVQIVPDCSTDPDITLVAAVLSNGNTGGMTYRWSTGETTPQITARFVDYSSDPSSANIRDYQVTVTNPNGCTRSDYYRCPGLISQAYHFDSPIISVSNAVCPANGSMTFTISDIDPGTSNVSAIAFISPGYQFQTFTIPNGGVSPQVSFNNLTPGNYRLYITTNYTNQNCGSMANFTIGTNNSISASSTVLQPSGCISGLPSNNGSIDLTLPAGNFSFLWSDLSTTEDITSLAAGHYNVIVTDQSNQCSQRFDFDLINSSGALPQISSVMTNDVSCHASSDGSAFLDVSGSQNIYSIQLSNGLGCNNCNNRNFQNLSAGTYTAIVTNINTGCSTTANVNIGDNLPVNVTTSMLPSCGSDGSINISSSGGSGNYSYTISPTAGIISSNTINSLPAGTYTVSASDQGCPGNSVSVGVDVLTYQCCSDPSSTMTISNSGFSTSGTSTITYTNEIIDVNGDITVTGNHTLELNNCTLNFAPGVRIHVLNNATLRILNNSYLKGCSTLWKGIEMEPGATIIIDNSRIEDAEYSVLGNSGTVLHLNYAHLNNNYIDIYYPNRLNPSFISLVISNSEFTCTGNLKIAYPGQLSRPLTKTLAGIYLDNVAAVNLTGSSYDNTFDGLNCGIYAVNSNLNIATSSFSNFAGYDTYTSFPADALGSGIYFDGRNGTYLLTENGINQISSPDFSNCWKGISVTSASASIKGNYIDNCDIGVQVQYSDFSKINISSNHIRCNRFGVHLLMNRTPDELIVIDNIIHCGQNAFCNDGSNAKTIGIRVDENNTTNILNHISENEIVLHNYGASGIQMLGANNYLLNSNIVTLNNVTSNSPMLGISLFNCNKNQVSCNHVAGTLVNQLNTTGESAYLFFYGNANTIECNTSTHTSNGYTFTGTCLNTNFKSNDIGNHYRGLYYTGSSLTGTQSLKGNLWYWPNYNGWAAENDNLIGAANEKYFIDQNGPVYSSLTPFTNYPQLQINPSYWFQQRIGVDENCGSTVHLGDCVTSSGGGESESFLDYIRVAADELGTTDYNQEMRWAADQALYEELLKAPTMLDSNSTLEDFYYSSAGSVIQKISKVNKDVIELYKNDQSLIDILKQNAFTIKENADAISELDSLLNTELLDSARIDFEGQKTMLIKSVNELIEFNQQAFASLKNSIDSKTDLINGSNDSIVGTEVFEQNKIVMNNVYLNCIEKKDFASIYNYEEAIRLIALQCPLTGGKAVFLARSLYSIIDPEQSYDDYFTCIQSGVLLKAGKRTIGFEIFPNPAFNKITIRYSSETDLICKIHNSLGVPVRSFTCDKNDDNIDLNLEELMSGSYFIVGENSNGERIFFKKFEIIK